MARIFASARRAGCPTAMAAWPCSALRCECETGSFGTRGSANDLCGSVTPTQCNGTSGVRPVVPPTAGDLVISEYLARPSAEVGCANGEWLEIYVAADVDLN